MAGQRAVWCILSMSHAYSECSTSTTLVRAAHRAGYKRGSMRVVVRGTLIRVVGFGGALFALYQAVQAREPFAAIWLVIAFVILGTLGVWIVRRGLRRA
jgi:hypothetical protein